MQIPPAKKLRFSALVFFAEGSASNPAFAGPFLVRREEAVRKTYRANGEVWDSREILAQFSPILRLWSDVPPSGIFTLR